MAKPDETIRLLVENVMRAIAVAVDELERGEFDPNLVRALLERCKNGCAEALRLLPSDP